MTEHNGTYTEIRTASADTDLVVGACSDWIDITHGKQAIRLEYNVDNTNAETADRLRYMADVLLNAAKALDNWKDTND